ncbi:hypothetical protein CTA2_4350 [Colletotrichum tanaceti]|uniref:Uncharacterized protein n=1 Tax=Colletotrichum tanaceti TaxID=1306861 RepID=A0A4U6XVA5_9PEZI|nr:hypothetical protein CTA2_4350 [Colletotrichum tanaceti]TKW59789.1 hypothetical protein CTA1_10408 [Colletotrichum tanaceti]
MSWSSCWKGDGERRKKKNVTYLMFVRSDQLLLGKSSSLELADPLTAISFVKGPDHRSVFLQEAALLLDEVAPLSMILVREILVDEPVIVSVFVESFAFLLDDRIRQRLTLGTCWGCRPVLVEEPWRHVARTHRNEAIVDDSRGGLLCLETRCLPAGPNCLLRGTSAFDNVAQRLHKGFGCWRRRSWCRCLFLSGNVQALSKANILLAVIRLGQRCRA